MWQKQTMRRRQCEEVDYMGNIDRKADSMKLTDDFEDQEDKSRLPMLYTTIGVIAFIALIVCVVISVNTDTTKRKQTNVSTQESAQAYVPQTDKNAQMLDKLNVGESTLTSDQLDFWDMYKDEQPVSDNSAIAMEEQYQKNAQKLLEEEKQKEKENDPSEGGTKTKVIRPDGTEQWIMVNAYIPKNTYKETGFVYEEPILKYYAQGARVSHLGVDIDADCGTVDYEALKNAGVEFVMLRLGFRGYESGNLSLDESYFDALSSADAAGLKIGVYFESQAVSAEEAQQEAQFVLDNISQFHITYPVAFDLGYVTGEQSRIDSIPKMQLTEITNAFCARVEEAGYKPIVYGNKYWLLRKIDLTQLGNYDIWLSQDGQIPDYPYTFSMWQYNQSATLSGMAKDARLTISFTDYSQR